MTLTADGSDERPTTNDERWTVNGEQQAENEDVWRCLHRRLLLPIWHCCYCSARCCCCCRAALEASTTVGCTPKWRTSVASPKDGFWIWNRHPNTYHTIEGFAELMQDTNPLNLACIYYSNILGNTFSKHSLPKLTILTFSSTFIYQFHTIWNFASELRVSFNYLNCRYSFFPLTICELT